MRLLFAILLSTAAYADEPAPPDPKAAPITTATSPQSPGPFTCKVDPYVTVQQGGTVGVRIVLTAPDGTHLYRDQVDVEVTDAAGLVVGTLVLPAGQPFEDPWGGGQREVLSGDATLMLPLTAPIDARGRLDLSIDVRWQGCSDHMCFMPGGQSFNLPVRVKKAR